MFDRFVRFTQARRALAAARPEEALRLVSDPIIASHRRAEELRSKALAALVVRAQERMRDRDFEGAAADLRTVLRWQPEHADARALEPHLRDAVAAKERDDVDQREVVQEVRATVEGGDLLGAEARLAAREAMLGRAEAESLRQLIANRSAAARRLVAEASQALRARHLESARELACRALSLDRAVEGGAALAADITRALGASVARAIEGDLDRGSPGDACGRILREEASWPDLGSSPEFRSARERAVAALRRRLEQRLRAGAFQDLLADHAALDPRVQSVALLGDLAPVLTEIREAVASAEAGDLTAAAGHFAAAAQRLDCPAIRAAHERAEAAAVAIASAIEAARKQSALGNIDGARQYLERAMAEWPLARALHQEMRLMDDGALERQSRLTAARQLANEGKLREACALALALASPGELGAAARKLQAELQAKIDVVAAGVDQIKRAVHGRGSGSIEGLGHCIARLDELAKVQTDHPELARLRAALSSERRGLELLREALAVCAGRGPTTRMAACAKDVVELRADLLRSDRLDARLLELADAAAARGEASCGQGRVGEAEACAEALGHIATVVSSAAARADELRQRIATARARALEAVGRGRAALDERNLAAAESAFDLACQAAADDDVVRAFGRDLERVRVHSDQLQEVEGMAARRDYIRAHAKLATLSPTPAVLRTKIFDLKRNLARAQGLDGGFMLRVDEGGEFLVMRGDSISIGNLRDGRADLVLLASISGQHARLQRRMSFHGGMEDRILADRGDVFVDGESVRERRLQDGDEIRLGQQLRFAYHVPSPRSLTALLRVLGGFQVRGTDKILLLKDRGRDGRILIGQARDAHVSVSVPGPEVELYSGLDGQIRVRCEGGGVMDGRPFTGDHPVAAGASVTCGQISFVLLPLSGG